MKKILYKKKVDQITSILDIVYDDKFSDVVKTTLIEEKMFYQLRKKSFEEYINNKINKGWIASSNNIEVIHDAIFGFIIKGNYGYLTTNKYLEIFKKYISIDIGRANNDDLENILKYKRKVFCEFVNLQDELKIKIQKSIFKYAKKEYKEIIEFYEGEERKSLLKSLKTAESVFYNLIEPTSLTICDKSAENEFKTKINLHFECDWDEEHGMGIAIENWEVVRVGQSSDIS